VPTDVYFCFIPLLELNTEFKHRCTIARTTTVFVTHNIEEAIFLGNKIAVMSQRPGQIMKIYEPKLSKNAQDAVKSRESREFEDLFQEIWENLKGNGSPEQRVIIRTYHEKQAKKRFRILSKFINP
jgi:ABC-type nitrate/sulfonate/bicarbonate transport system ATPase subunit